MKKIVVFLMVLTIASSALAGDFATDRLDNWHQWRGPEANGVAPKGHPPAKWGESTHIRWKVEIPGSGSATPVIWNDRIYILTAVGTGRKSTVATNQARPGARPGSRRRGRGRSGMSTPAPTSIYQFLVLCLDADTGKVIWKKVANKEVPHEGHHPSHGFASASPTTDGQYLYVSFGSRGIFCFDLEGNLKWKLDPGDMNTRNNFGEGTSPVVHGDSLIINWDHEGDSFILCLDVRTGKEKWRVPRDEVTTWATPLVVEHDGVTQVVTNGTNRTRSYDLATGNILWQCGGQATNPIPCPVTSGGVVYCMTGYRGYALYAIPLAAKGDITNTEEIVWKKNDNTPYVASPLLYDGLLYMTKSRSGILSCLDAKTGKVHYSDQRLSGIDSIYASLVGADGKVYITGRDGTTVVLKHGPTYEVLATNKLDEGIDASPVIVGERLYLRGTKHLYCIVEN